MRVRFAVLVGLVLSASSALPALAAAGTACTDGVQVSWRTNWDAATVEGIVVAADGCGDGEPVGIQLLTDDGDVPADGPLMGEVSDERAFFDITEYAVRIEPVTGIRVFLQVSDGEQYTWQITVDRRFFNQAGNEQVGLRQLTVLNVPHGGSYTVPGAPTRYDEVVCADVGHEPDGVIAEGSGTFHDVSRSGLHIACYQQRPGTPGAPPPGPGGPGAEQPVVIPPDESSDPDDDTDVLDEVREQDGDDDTDVRGEVIDRRPTGGGQAGVLGRLAMTGSDVLLATTVGLATLGLGLVLLRRRRA